MPTRFSTKDVNKTAEKIYSYIADKNTDEAYKHLASYFREAKTKVIKQAVLKVRLKVLIARIKALKLGVFSQKNILIEDLVSTADTQTNNSANLQSAEINENEKKVETIAQVSDENDERLAQVSIIENVEVLGTSFAAGTVVEVPVKQLAELVDTGKAEIISKKSEMSVDTATKQNEQDEITQDVENDTLTAKKQVTGPSDSSIEKPTKEQQSEKVNRSSDSVLESKIDDEEITKALEIPDKE